MPNANIDYVTSHQGQAHITTQNVIDLLGGISGDITGIKKFPLLYNGLANEIVDSLTIQVKTGAALAGGSFFILEEAFDWLLDAGVVGYSRIDVLYLVMYENPDTNVQSCDFVYQVGELYPNGTTGTVPPAPTASNISATYPFLRMDMTDGSIVNVTEYAQAYLSNSDLVTTVADLVEELEDEVGGTVAQVATNKADIAQMKVDFQAGVDTIYGAIVSEGVTPSASTPQACATGIHNLANTTWENDVSFTFSAEQSIMGYHCTGSITLPCNNMVSIRGIIGPPTYAPSFVFYDAGGRNIKSGDLSSLGGPVTVPNNAVKVTITHKMNGDVSLPYNGSESFYVKYQSKKIR